MTDAIDTWWRKMVRTRCLFIGRHWAGKNLNSLPEFHGKMHQERVSDPAAFKRVQFMKYFN